MPPSLSVPLINAQVCDAEIKKGRNQMQGQYSLQTVYSKPNDKQW